MTSSNRSSTQPSAVNNEIHDRLPRPYSAIGVIVAVPTIGAPLRRCGDTARARLCGWRAPNRVLGLAVVPWSLTRTRSRVRRPCRGLRSSRPAMVPMVTPIEHTELLVETDDEAEVDQVSDRAEQLACDLPTSAESAAGAL